MPGSFLRMPGSDNTFWADPLPGGTMQVFRLDFGYVDDNFKRALACLRARLSKHQLTDYEREGAFVCIGKVTGIAYRVEPTSYVRVLPHGFPMCIAPSVALHIPDQMLTKKIHIETNEYHFLLVSGLGNHFSVRGWDGRSPIRFK